MKTVICDIDGTIRIRYVFMIQFIEKLNYYLALEKVRGMEAHGCRICLLVDVKV